MFDFIADLDAFFCEKYANYDKICVLPGYKRPVMQATRVNEDGSTYSYTLPMETMKLANQEHKEEILKELKTRLVDNTFSFSFFPYGFFKKLKMAFSPDSFHRNLRIIFEKYNLTMQSVGKELNISKEIWSNIWFGKFAPTKNVLFSIALVAHLSFEDTQYLMDIIGYEWDYSVAKDVVITYLLQQEIYNREMIDAALKEYSVENLFLK